MKSDFRQLFPAKPIPKRETAFNPAGPETKHSGYGQATAAYAPVTEPFPAIQKPVDPTRRQNGSGYGSQNETSPYPQRSGNDDERGSSRLSEESRRAIRETVNERLSELRVYVLESDITEAQQAVKKRRGTSIFLKAINPKI